MDTDSDEIPAISLPKAGKKIAVIGGGAVSLDVVEFFAPRGAEVSIVEMLPAIGNGIDPISKVGTFAMMEKYGVSQITKTSLKKVRPDSFYVETPEGPEDIPPKKPGSLTVRLLSILL